MEPYFYRVDKDQIVKVADFGLSRDLFCDDYYVMEQRNTPLPIKWMSIESITSHHFSSKTDVVGTGTFNLLL